MSTSPDDEDKQLQEGESDFDYALADSRAYDLLDNAMHVLDDMIQHNNQR
jgi:hypothetical protein